VKQINEAVGNISLIFLQRDATDLRGSRNQSNNNSKHENIKTHKSWFFLASSTGCVCVLFQLMEDFSCGPRWTH
jgi:hypothetical protein